jgi:hypothetical protein
VSAWFLFCCSGFTGRVSNQAKKDIEKLLKSNKVRAEGGLGAGISYILDDFEGEALAAAIEAFSDPVKYGIDPQFPMDPEDPNFHQIKAVMAHGDKAKGKGLPCPRDGLEDCAIVE